MLFIYKNIQSYLLFEVGLFSLVIDSTLYQYSYIIILETTLYFISNCFY